MGGTAYSTGKAKTISGITADDKTGKITIHLTKAYGPFDNVLAFPAMGLRPDQRSAQGGAGQPAPGRRALQGDEHRPQPVLLGRQELELDADPGHPLRAT